MCDMFKPDIIALQNDPWNNPFEIRFIQQDIDNPMFEIVSYGSNPNDPSGAIVVQSH